MTQSNPNDERPLISVVIPTFRRAELLPRAVASVLTQTFTNWELIISDDEDLPAETWKYLESLADPRIRIIQNPGPHGQCGNVTHAMRQARGQWIKFLFDDDALRPRCLEIFVAAVAGQEGVVIASCNVAQYRDGKMISSGRQNGPFLLRIPQRYLHLGMYLQDDVGGGVPSQTMVNRIVIDRGIFFDAHTELRSNVDSYFFVRAAALGDSLLIRIPLVDFHQGQHQSVTASIGQEELDAEFRVLRRIQLPLIDPALNPPSLATVTQMLQAIRAIHRASRRQFGEALVLALKTWRPRAWWLAAQWLGRRRNPDRFSRIPRQVLDDAPIRAIADLDPCAETLT